jgi:hypothetical protein
MRIAALLIAFLMGVSAYFSGTIVVKRQFLSAYTFKTEPAQFNVPIDTSVYRYFLPWDFQFDPFPWNCNFWYPTCGGCIVYNNGWPLGNLYFPTISLEGQIGTAQEVVKADSVAVFIDTTETMAVVDTTSIQKKLTRKEKWQKRWAQFHFFRKK